MPKCKKRALLLLAAALTLSVSLYGCTGDTQPSESPTASAQSGEPSYGGSVTVGISQDLDSLDPHKAVAAGSSEVLFNIFEGLVKASSDGEVREAVASDYQVSEDGLTYTFTLREGVTFHNGDPVTVEDVVYSLERCAGSENNGTPLISAFSNVTDISAPDDSHVVLTLAEPSLEFIYSMTAAIIPAGSGDGIAQDPIGTGPFRYVSYTPQDSMVIEKYDGYWGEEAYLDQVTFRIITNSDTLVMSLQSGSLDMAIHVPNTQASQVEGAFTVVEDTMKLVQALYLNNAVEPFDDVRVRQALCYAINVQDIIDLVCDGAGVQVGSSMYPAFGKYYMEELNDAYPYDVEKAKEFLAEAGYPDGFTMDITVPGNYAQHVQTGEVIAEQLKEVGITANIVQVEWETWVSQVYQGREYQSTVCGVAASDMTAREMVIRYVSDNSRNFLNFNDTEYDQAVEQAGTSLDADEQEQLYKRALTILSEQAASVWIQDLCDLTVMSPELGGLEMYRTYVLDMSTIYYYA